MEEKVWIEYDEGSGKPSRKAVLDAFAVEHELGRVTLERYLGLYPEYAGELVDLSRELNREITDDAGPLSTADQALLDMAWSRHAVKTEVRDEKRQRTNSRLQEGTIS